jgi:hypothetical protein
LLRYAEVPEGAWLRALVHGQDTIALIQRCRARLR